MSTLPRLDFTEEEYLAYDLAHEGKHEFVNGEIVAMSGASEDHGLVVGNLHGALHQQLRGRPCRAFIADLRVRIDETGLYAYPDIVVTCGEREFAPTKPDSLLNPTVIFEVLSPSTENHDRGTKVAHYRRRPSLRDIVLVHPIARYVEHYARVSDNEWRIVTLTSGDLALPSIGAKLPLAEIFEGLGPRV